jgi:thiol-disulfide isomerase/thioredoxin
MRKIFYFVLYTVTAFGANPAVSDPLDALRAGDMRNLNLSAPQEIPDVAVTSLDGKEMRFSEHEGKVVLLNFWATWCAPCKEEMPALERLETRLGGDDFAVIPVATGRQSTASIEKFFTEADINALPIWLDPKSELARGVGVAGLPATLILDRDGKERGRLVGPAEWDGEHAVALIEAIIAE